MEGVILNQFGHILGGYLELEGAKIYYEELGLKTAPVLLFLHGAFGNVEDFNCIISNFHQNYRIIGIDCRGQGKSTLGNVPLTYAQIQKDIESVLEHLNINKLSIIGFSDGGIVAYRLATNKSLTINHLVTIGARWHMKNTEAIQSLIDATNSKDIVSQMPDIYYVYMKLAPEPDFSRLTKSLVKMWMDNSESGYPNEKIKEITASTLIVRGENDILLYKNAVAEVSKLINNSKVLEIPSAGHVAFFDGKDLFLREVNKFLQ